MLKELHLRDFLIIRQANLSLTPGLVVFTGETGAGKSILVQALKLLLGGRAPGELISPGAKEARVEAIFEVDRETVARLKAADLPVEEELLVRRVIGQGRSRAYINDTPVTVSRLAEIVGPLVAISGQHEFQRLLSPEDQLALLDAYAGLGKELKAYRDLFAAWHKVLRELKELEGQERQRELDFLRFQIKEIEEAALRPKEDEELLEKRRRLKALGRLRDLSQLSYDILYAGEGSLISQAGRLRQCMRELCRLDEATSSLIDTIEGLYYQLEDIALEVRNYLEGLPEDAHDLEAIEERLAQIETLKRKYGPTLEDVFETLTKARERLASLENLEENRTQIQGRLKILEGRLQEEANRLHAARQTASQKLSRIITKELADLGMTEARFVVRLEEAPLGAKGLDRASFLIQANPDLPLRPLAQVASGGELSRIFLALKVALAERSTPAVLLFDEVDTGIGGTVARVVGQRLKRLARIHQVLAVTHLPQIAAFADQHFLVSKERTKQGTSTIIRRLKDEDRLTEIARMLGRPEGTEAVEFARKLITESSHV
ncbi:DNA repair protein RecN [Thermosulfuriphilus sp.]